jgi:hypothetical protein
MVDSDFVAVEAKRPGVLVQRWWDSGSMAGEEPWVEIIGAVVPRGAGAWASGGVTQKHDRCDPRKQIVGQRGTAEAAPDDVGALAQADENKTQIRTRQGVFSNQLSKQTTTLASAAPIGPGVSGVRNTEPNHAPHTTLRVEEDFHPINDTGDRGTHAVGSGVEALKRSPGSDEGDLDAFTGAGSI